MANTNDLIRTQLGFEEGAVTTTEDTVFAGFGFEGLAPGERDDLDCPVMEHCCPDGRLTSGSRDLATGMAVRRLLYLSQDQLGLGGTNTGQCTPPALASRLSRVSTDASSSSASAMYEAS